MPYRRSPLTRIAPGASSARRARPMATSSSAWGRSWLICAAAVLMPELLLRTVYGPSSPYLAVGLGLQLLAVAGVLDYIAEMISKTLLGVEAGRLASVVNAVAVGVAAVLAFALIGPLGVLGACLALLTANLVRATGAVIAIAWLIAKEKISRAGAVCGLRQLGSDRQSPRCSRGTRGNDSDARHASSNGRHLGEKVSRSRFPGATGISRCSRSCCWAMR